MITQRPTFQKAYQIEKTSRVMMDVMMDFRVTLRP